MQIREYNRENAVHYAREWAFLRNPAFYNFDKIGGDCTNFISQCVYAGGGAMNYTPTFGWFYKSAGDRTPSWSGVEYFYNFMVNNRGIGPFAQETTIDAIMQGDVVQLSFDGAVYKHSLIVVSKGEKSTSDDVLTATHTCDFDNRPLATYIYQKARFIHLLGVRTE